MGRLLRSLLKIFCLGLSALLGTATGIIMFSSLLTVSVDGSSMMPSLEPGTNVLVLQESLLTGPPAVQVGDLVLYEAPYYTTDGEGLRKIRRVTGMRGDWIRINCDAKTVRNQELLVRREDILGKVILKLPG